MGNRVRLETNDSKPSKGGRYYTEEDADDSDKGCELWGSGSVLFDCVLGGGYPVGRVINLVGDESTGKTLQWIEGAANFAQIYPDPALHKIRIYEGESAFDRPYAAQVGLPVERCDFAPPLDTVEEFFEDLVGTDAVYEAEEAAGVDEEDVKKKPKKKRVAGWLNNLPDAKDGGRAFVVLDSLDALSSKSEMESSIEKGSYGTSKAKVMSQLFRRAIRLLERKGVTLMIISQVRDKIGVMFGEKHTRSGGRALNFYASQIVWLSQVGKLHKTKKKVKRTVGVEIKARCKKNKVGPPHREVEYSILFNYGVDDVVSGVNWLRSVFRGDVVDAIAEKYSVASYKKTPKGGKGEPYFDVDRIDDLDDDQYRRLRKGVNRLVRAGWADIESDFAPVRKKYA